MQNRLFYDGERKNEVHLSTITLGQKICAEEAIHFDSSLPHSTHFGDTLTQLVAVFLNQTCPVTLPSALETTP